MATRPRVRSVAYGDAARAGKSYAGLAMRSAWPEQWDRGSGVSIDRGGIGSGKQRFYVPRQFRTG